MNFSSYLCLSVKCKIKYPPNLCCFDFCATIEFLVQSAQAIGKLCCKKVLSTSTKSKSFILFILSYFELFLITLTTNNIIISLFYFFLLTNSIKFDKFPIKTENYNIYNLKSHFREHWIPIYYTFVFQDDKLAKSSLFLILY